MSRFVIAALAWGCASTDDDGDDTSEPNDTDTEGADTDDTDVPDDTDTDPVAPVEISFRQVASGYHPGAPAPGADPLCDDVGGELLLDQDDLTNWGLTNAEATLEYTVQWDHELAIGVLTSCSTTNHLVTCSKVEDVGGGALVMTCSITTLANSEPFDSTAWGAFAVEGTDWTSVSFVTEDKS